MVFFIVAVLSGCGAKPQAPPNSLSGDARIENAKIKGAKQIRELGDPPASDDLP
jgi:hypothetical protein